MCQDCGCCNNWESDVYENEDRWYDISTDDSDDNDDDDEDD